MSISCSVLPVVDFKLNLTCHSHASQVLTNVLMTRLFCNRTALLSLAVDIGHTAIKDEILLYQCSIRSTMAETRLTSTIVSQRLRLRSQNKSNRECSFTHNKGIH